MTTVGSAEARTHFYRLVAEAANGETITITKHGVPIADLVPHRNDAKPDVAEVIRQIHEFRERENINLDGIAIRELIEEGRR